MIDNVYNFNLDFSAKILDLNKYRFIRGLRSCEKCQKAENGNWIFCPEHLNKLRELYLKEVLK